MVRYCIEAGQKAIATPLVISEYYTLTDFERDAIYQTTVGAVAGRVKVLAGVSGVSIVHAARLAEMATKAGVDGLIATPPTIANDEEAIRYFNEITDASQLPLMIQNAPPPTGGSISDAAMIEILETNRFVFSIKQELHPDTHTIGKTLELTKAINLLFMVEKRNVPHFRTAAWKLWHDARNSIDCGDRSNLQPILARRHCRCETPV